MLSLEKRGRPWGPCGMLSGECSGGPTFLTHTLWASVVSLGTWVSHPRTPLQEAQVQTLLSGVLQQVWGVTLEPAFISALILG